MTTEEKQVVREANNGGGNVLLAEEGLDVEQGGVPHDNDNGQESSSTPHQQKGEQHQGIIELQQALLGLCWAIIIKWGGLLLCQAKKRPLASILLARLDGQGGRSG
jgi:hypothetical protein